MTKQQPERSGGGAPFLVVSFNRDFHHTQEKEKGYGIAAAGKK